LVPIGDDPGAFESYREEIKVACYAKDVGFTAHA
jgi:hypothetical protein